MSDMKNINKRLLSSLLKIMPKYSRPGAEKLALKGMKIDPSGSQKVSDIKAAIKEEFNTDLYGVHDEALNNFSPTLAAYFYEKSQGNVRFGLSSSALGKRKFYIEMENSIQPTTQDETHVLVYDESNGNIIASIYNPVVDVLEPLVIKDTQNKEFSYSPAIILGMFVEYHKFIYEESSRSKAKTLGRAVDLVDEAIDEDKDLTPFIGHLSRVLHSIFATGELEQGEEFNFSLGASSRTLVDVKLEDVENGVHKPDSILFGSGWVLFLDEESEEETDDVIQTRNIEDHFGSFAKEEKRNFTRREKELIKRNEEDLASKGILVSKEAQIIAALADEEDFFFELYGQSGSGKSTTAAQIAALKGLPMVRKEVRPDTDTGTLLGQFVPETDNAHEALTKFRETLPSLEEFMMMPDLVYLDITGEAWKGDRKDLTEEVYHRIVEDAERLAVKTGAFRFEKSLLVQAFEHGWVCELQEANVAHPGVLVGLNSMLEEGQVTLDNGETVYRHPDAIIVMTSNHGYLDTNDLQQSVVSRLTSSFPLNTPSPEEATERVMSTLKISQADRELVYEMAVITDKIEQVIKTRGLTGICDFRSLRNWAKTSLIIGDIEEAFKPTVLYKATKDEQEIQHILGTIFEESTLYNINRGLTKEVLDV